MTGDGSIGTLILSGSGRPKSHSVALARAVSGALANRGMSSRIIDLSTYGLPFHNPVDHHDPLSSASPLVRELAGLALAADSLVWITPIYHGSMSGILKNAIDNLYMDLTEDKPLMLVANGGGRFGGSVFDHMRAAAVSQHMNAVTCQVLALPADFAETADGYELTEPAIAARIAKAAGQLDGLRRIPLARTA
jgi:NAD(P)H-dependent FMN reductase